MSPKEVRSSSQTERAARVEDMEEICLAHVRRGKVCRQGGRVGRSTSVP